MQNKIFQQTILNQRNRILTSQPNTMLRFLTSQHYTMLRFFSNSVIVQKLLSIKEMSEKEKNQLIQSFANKQNHRMHADVNRVSKFFIQDISVLKLYGQIVLFQDGKGAKIKYGKEGFDTSNKIPHLEDLIEYEKEIPQDSLSLIKVANNTAFKIDGNNKIAVITNPEEIYDALPYEDRKKECKVCVMIKLESKIAKKLYNQFVETIHKNPKKEKFFEEVTLPFLFPTAYYYVKSSQTLMHFSESQEDTTDMHYHSGERELIIITTDKPASAVLNVCGTNESPDEHPECSVEFKLEPNSISVLKFPPYTHHKFYGDFVCTSVHPREGQNFIKALNEGDLGNFLESNTVLSLHSRKLENHLGLQDDKKDIRLDMEFSSDNSRLETSASDSGEEWSEKLDKQNKGKRFPSIKQVGVAM
jgi:hypothetical protein